MKGRKRGCFLPLTFFMLFVCIAGHATDDSDDGEEEDVLGKSSQKQHKKLPLITKPPCYMHSKCTSVLDFFFLGKIESGTKHATVLKTDWVLN